MARSSQLHHAGAIPPCIGITGVQDNRRRHRDHSVHSATSLLAIKPYRCTRCPEPNSINYPTAGSAPIVYALADRGARLLVMHGELDASHIEWSRKNREAGRPFIEHQLEIADFEVATQLSTERSGYHYIDADEIVFKSSTTISNSSNPISVRVVVSHRGARHDIGLTPDLAFAVELKNGTRRDFLVEIDRGTMPISRADFLQTSIERKLRCYLSAHASRVFERKFGWKFFRVLIVTSNDNRVRSMIKALRSIQPPSAAGSSLFLFASRDDLRARDPFSATWRGVNGWQPHRRWRPC
jgi:Replication-relaxation